MDISVTSWLGTRQNSHIRLLPIVVSPTSVPLPSFFRVLATIEDQIREYGFTTRYKQYPDGELWTESPDPPEFRRFPSLRNEYPVCQTMLMVCGVPSSPCVLSVDHLLASFPESSPPLSRLRTQTESGQKPFRQDRRTHEFSRISSRSAIMGGIDSVGRVRDMGWRGEESKTASAG